MITSAQIAAARKLLGWRPSKLAEKAKISTTIVRRAESLYAESVVTVENLIKIKAALETGGVEFTNGDGPGGEVEESDLIPLHHTVAPFWLQFIQPVATAILGIGAAILGYYQWRTAHNRLVLDLFERRMKVYDNIRGVLVDVLRFGARGATLDLHRSFVVAATDAQFLFGAEVTEYLDNFGSTLLRMRFDEKKLSDENFNNVDLEHQSTLVEANMKKIAAFYIEFPAIISKYVKMDQKRV